MADVTAPVCSSAEDCLAQGRKARSAAQWDQAFACIWQGLEISPGNLGLRLELVVILRLSERLEEARAQIEALLIEQPAHFGVVIEAGHVARQQRRFEDALKHYQQAQLIQPQHQWAPVGAAVALRELGHYEESKVALQTILDSTPEYFDALVEMGHLAARQRAHADAVHHFRQALAVRPLHDTLPVHIASHLRELGRLDEAKTTLNALLFTQPNHFGALLESGRIARQQARFADAIAFFERALAVRPENEWLPCGIAACLRESGRVDEAQTLLSQLLASKPDHFDAVLEWVNLLRPQGRHEEALATLRKAESLGLNNEWLPIKIAGCLRELHRFDEARVLLEDLLKAKPNHFNARTELGQMARQQSRYNEAIEHFQKALAINPSNASLPCTIASCLRNLGRLDECKAALERILASSADQFDALVESGHLANRQRRADEALDFFRRAFALRPQTRSLSLNIAYILRELGQFEQAREILIEALKMQPDYFEALVESGHLARRERKGEEALDFFQRACAIRPQHQGVQLAVINELRELGRIEEALAAIGELTAPYDPSMAPLVHQRGQIASFQDDFELAQHYFEASIEIDPLFVSGYSSLIDVQLRLGLCEDAQSTIHRATQRVADPSQFQIREIRFASQYGEYERVEEQVKPLLANNPKSSELWMILARARTRAGEYAKAQDAISRMPNQYLQDRIWIEECKAHLAWSQYQLEAAVSHAQEWLRLSPDPAPALHYLSLLHVSSGNTEEGAKTLATLKKLRQSHGSASIRKSAGKDLLDNLLRELRVNPFANRSLAAALQLPIAERPPALGLALLDEPNYVGSSMAMLITLSRLALIGDEPVSHGPVPSRIPRHVIQFWDNDPPPDITELMQTWTTQCSGFTHEVFNEIAAESFIAKECQPDVLRAFKTATQPTMKSDLFRLAYLYARGGIYADADDKCRHSIEPWLTNGLDLLLLQEDLGSIGNNFIAAAPNHPLILAALKAVTQNILHKQGGGAWWSSGPAMLSLAFCNLYLDALSQSRMPGGVQIINCYHITKRISMHVPRAYKNSDKHWSSPKSQARREFTYNKAIRIDRTNAGWTLNVAPELR